MAKRYSVNVEDERVVSVEVNGKVYADPEEIPDPQDREKVQRMIDRLLDPALAEELTAQTRPSVDLGKIVFGVFLGVAVLMLIILGLSAAHAVRTLSREARAQGTVVKLVVRPGSDGSAYYYPIIAYNLPGEGILTVELSEGSWPAAYRVGEVVGVRYDPQRPQSARIDSFSSMLNLWILPVISGFLGAAFLGGAIFARWINKETAGLDADFPDDFDAAFEEFDKPKGRKGKSRVKR